MRFRVHGYRDGVLYALDVDDTASGPDGVVVACQPPSVLEDLRERQGEQVLGSITGPAYRVDLDDPKAVLAALHEWTRVIRVEGEAPDIAPEPTEDIDLDGGPVVY